MVDGAEGLGQPVDPGNGHEGARGLCAPQHPGKELRRQQWHIDWQKNIERLAARGQRGFNAAQGAAPGMQVRNDRGVRRKIRARGRDARCGIER